MNEIHFIFSRFYSLDALHWNLALHNECSYTYMTTHTIHSRMHIRICLLGRRHIAYTLIIVVNSIFAKISAETVIMTTKIQNVCRLRYFEVHEFVC